MLTDPWFEDDHCANCCEPLADEVAGLYCSELCSQTAGLIRWWRRKERSGQIDDPEVVTALRFQVAHVLSGGYPARARHLPDRVRRQVWERDEGLCRSCGEPGKEIDHIDGDSADLSNLQLLCVPCHHAKTEAHIGVMATNRTTDPAGTPTELAEQVTLKDLMDRVMGDPSRLCDDEIAWPGLWGALKKERGQRLLERRPPTARATIRWADLVAK